MLHTATDTIKKNVMALPGDDRKMVGIITYDGALHFYKLKVCASCEPAPRAPRLLFRDCSAGSSSVRVGRTRHVLLPYCLPIAGYLSLEIYL